MNLLPFLPLLMLSVVIAGAVFAAVDNPKPANWALVAWAVSLLIVTCTLLLKGEPK